MVVCSFLAPTPLVVNEVLYDPAGSDRGLEFVEILNVSQDDVCLDGWRLETGNGAYEDRWRVEWIGSEAETLGAGSFLVIGESRVSPEPDIICDLDLQNGPDACRLVGPGGQIDVVGWGELEFDVYFEGSPVACVPSGYSIGRDPDGRDTDCNEIDFAGFSEPTPGDFNRPPRDLALLKVSPSRYTSEASSTVDLVCLVANKGLEAFGRGTSIVAVTSVARESTRIDRDIEPGERKRFVVRMPRPGEGLHLVTTWLENRQDLRSGNDSITTSFVIKPPPVVINEILFCPSGKDCEWIELLCRLGEVDIAGWTLEDSNRQPLTITTQSTVLREGEMVVLVEDEDVFGAIHPGLRGYFRPAGGWVSLNDNDGPLGFADKIVIRDRYGTAVDSVAYCRRWCDCGVSLERIDPASPSGDPATWSPHYGKDVGSPGDRNSVSVFVPDERGYLRLAPRVITPDGDGRDDLVGIRIRLPEPARVNLKVYDVRGAPIVTLLQDEPVEKARTTFWDGNASEGRHARTGIYIIVLRARGSRDGTIYEARGPVIVVRR